MKKVSFRIRKIYFDQTVAGTKPFELRSYTPFWIKRLLWNPPPRIAVFVCGSKKHQRWIKNIKVGKPVEFLGRELSEQGKQDISTELCIATYLGGQVIQNEQKALDNPLVYDPLVYITQHIIDEHGGKISPSELEDIIVNKMKLLKDHKEFQKEMNRIGVVYRY